MREGTRITLCWDENKHTDSISLSYSVAVFLCLGGHCNALAPKYDELGKKVQSDSSMKDVIIAKIDATANDYDRQKWSVSGYPTIFFKPAGKKAQVYEGAREVKDLLDYVKRNGKTIKKGKKKGKKSKKD